MRCGPRLRKHKRRRPTSSSSTRTSTRRPRWVAGLLPVALGLAAAVAGGGAALAERDDGARWSPDPVVAAEDREWLAPGLGSAWLALPPKAERGDVVASQGGLWSLDVPVDGGGDVVTVAGEEPAPRDAERVVQVEIRVERGIGTEAEEFARQVMDTLNDERGWGHDGSVAFARTAGPDADFHLTLASPATTDALCAPVPTRGEVSCGRIGYAVLNAQRWAEGAEPFLDAGGDVGEYRRYLVNHEVGHVLGNGHVPCPGPGQLAPVMLQQTLRLDGCTPNGWVSP